MQTHTHPFIRQEIRNLAKLRLAFFTFLATFNFGIIGSLGYMAFGAYTARKLAIPFWLHAGPTLLYLQLLLLVPIVPLVWLARRRFRVTIAQLNGLNDFFANLYQKYCAYRPRLFSGIPAYIFSQHGLVMNASFRQTVLQANDFNRIHTVTRAYWPNACTVRFYQDQTIVATLRYLHYYTPQAREVEFLLAHIALIHPSVTITQHHHRL